MSRVGKEGVHSRLSIPFPITALFFAFVLFGSINTPVPFIRTTLFRFLVAYRNPVLRFLSAL